MNDSNNITENIIIDSEDIISDVKVLDNQGVIEEEDNSIQDKNIDLSNQQLEFDSSKQKLMSKEEAEIECKMTTHNKLIELGQDLANRKSKEEAFKNLYNNLTNEFNDLIPSFNVDEIDKSFNLDMFVQKHMQKEHFAINSEDKIKNLKLFVLLKMNQKVLKNQESKNESLHEEINDLNDQSDEYIAQIEEMEEKEKENNKKIAERIIKLRTKCIERRKQINYMMMAMVYLTYVAICSKETAFYHIQFTFSELIFPFLEWVLNTGTFLVHTIYTTVPTDFFKIFFGIFIGFLTLNLYSKKIKQKEN